MITVFRYQYFSNDNVDLITLQIMTAEHTADTTRDRIVHTAVKLLAKGGCDAISTRAVSAAAGIQAPTIYRLFGDKQGLLDAVAIHGFTTYLESKTAQEPGDDPVEDLRTGWDMHLNFGLENPELYALMYGALRPGVTPPAAKAATDILAGLVHRIAEAGRLRASEDQAVQLVNATGRGTTFVLISLPAEQRDPAISRLAREAIIAAITTDEPVTNEPGPAHAAIALQAILPQTTALSTQEQGLMQEWLDRIARAC